MRKAIGLIVLSVGLGVVAAPALAPVDAQEKKSKAREDAKEKRTTAAAGTVEIHKAKDGYRFRIKDAEGKTIAMSTRGFETKDECHKSLEEVKAILDKVRPTEVKE